LKSLKLKQKKGNGKKTASDVTFELIIKEETKDM